MTEDFQDLFDPRHRADPHPLYHRLRADAPVFAHVDPSGGTEWILTRFEDCEAVLRDPRWSVAPSNRGTGSDDDNFLGGMSMDDFPIMLFLDPPDHTRLRRLVSKAFTPRTVERLRPRVQSLLDGIIDPLVGAGPFDVIEHLAYPLPVTVICELLGVPVADQAGFAGWSSDAARLLDGDTTEDDLNRGLAAVLNFLAYFDELFERRRSDPGDDLISQLLAVEEQGDTLTQNELRTTVLLLFVAGHETTMNLIGNGLYQLLTHRDQWSMLGTDPALAAGAVEESLRFDGPVHLSGRSATEAVTVGGHEFLPTQAVVTLLAAGNRDPAHYVDPDRFDITRTENRHLTFSHGLHFCLGAALARLEGQVVFGSLAARPDVQLVTTAPTYRDHLVLRGYERLEISIG